MPSDQTTRIPAVPARTPMFRGIDERFSAIEAAFRSLVDELVDQGVSAKIAVPAVGERLRLHRDWLIFFEKRWDRDAAEAEGGTGAAKQAVFNVNKSINTSEESLIPQHWCLGTAHTNGGGSFVEVCGHFYVPPSGQDARLNIELSSDDGSTWNSIFADGYITWPQDDDALQDFDQDVFDETYNAIAPGDMLRLNASQVGSATPGRHLFMKLRWE
jgi:hypothetical protein